MTERPLTVSVVGFSPGFAYLDGLPEALRAVPRRDRPRPVVPAGSVALANGHAAVYPTASPGGWQLVGRTGFPLLSLARPPYAVLAPGDRVRFAGAGADDPLEPAPPPLPGWTVPARARRVLEVVAPGLRAVVQDGGRRGVAAVGVPSAGPADPVSFALANAARRQCRRLGDPGAHRWRYPPARPGGVPRRRRRRRARTPRRRRHRASRAGRAPGGRAGARGGAAAARMPHLPVGGGRDPRTRGVREQRERRAVRDRTRPAPTGARLDAGPVTPPLGDHLTAGAAVELDEGAPVELRVVPGPHPERFAPGALTCLADVVFRVERDSNRVGLRLRADLGAADLRGHRGRSGRARLAGRGDRRRAGAARRRPGRPHARSRHARRLPGPGRRGLGRPRPARPVRPGHPGPARPRRPRRGARGRPDRAAAPWSGRWSGTTPWPSAEASRGAGTGQTSSFTAVPTPMTTTTTRRAGAGRARARRAPT